MNDNNRKNNGRRAVDKCTCEDPYRFNNKKIEGDMEKTEDEIEKLWSAFGKSLSAKTFWAFTSLLIVVLIAMFGSMYQTNRQTLDLVIKINTDIGKIKNQQEIINKLIPHT